MKNCIKACVFFFAAMTVNLSFAQSQETQINQVNLEKEHLATSIDGVNAYLITRTYNDKTYLALNLQNTNEQAVNVKWSITKGQETFNGPSINVIEPDQLIDVFDVTQLIEIEPGEDLEDFEVVINP